VRFLGVDYRDDDAAGRAFVDEFRLPYPSITDPSGSLAYDYELIGFPTTVIIDPAGTIRYRFVGYLDEAVLEDALNDVVSRVPS
jgi:peroxiredoxin